MRQLISTLYALAEVSRALKQATIAEDMLAAARRNLTSLTATTPGGKARQPAPQNDPTISHQARLRRDARKGGDRDRGR